jgi:hypothetical protein
MVSLGKLIGISDGLFRLGGKKSGKSRAFTAVNVPAPGKMGSKARGGVPLLPELMTYKVL